MSEEKVKIDYDKLHKELRNTYERQCEIRRKLAKPFTPAPVGDIKAWDKWAGENKDYLQAWSEFRGLSHRMTILCCILNHSKGRLHMHQYEGEPMTPERQGKLIGSKYLEFIKTQPVEETASL